MGSNTNTTMKNKEETQLEKALKEADEVVDTMLEQSLKDQQMEQPF